MKDPMERFQYDSPESVGVALTAHYRRTQDTFICPACGLDAIYSPRPDRFFHIDGSDNQDCWFHMGLDDLGCSFHTAADHADMADNDPEIRWWMGMPVSQP